MNGSHKHLYTGSHVYTLNLDIQVETSVDEIYSKLSQAWFTMSGIASICTKNSHKNKPHLHVKKKKKKKEYYARTKKFIKLPIAFIV